MRRGGGLYHAWETRCNGVTKSGTCAIFLAASTSVCLHPAAGDCWSARQAARLAPCANRPDPVPQLMGASHVPGGQGRQVSAGCSGPLEGSGFAVPCARVATWPHGMCAALASAHNPPPPVLLPSPS
jgi:hypothetical protein